MLTEKNSNPLSTDDCFYSGNGEHSEYSMIVLSIIEIDRISISLKLKHQ